MRYSANRSTVARVLGCLVIAAAALIPTGGARASSVSPESQQAQALERQVREVAAAYDVPSELLLAIGYVNTRWEFPRQASKGGGWGPMHLVQEASGNTLRHAARLTGQSVHALKTELRANLRGGAAVLAQAAGKPYPSGLDDWYMVVAQLRGPLHAEQVFDALRRGVSTRVSTGGQVTLEPQPVARHARPGARRTRTADTDYPEATWYPAAGGNYADANRPSSNPINKIVVHVTQETYADTIDIFQDPSSNVSAHYLVRSADGAVAQFVRESDIAYHAGNYSYNETSIGIEHEGWVDDPSWFTDAMYQSSAKLAAYLVEKYSIPIDRNHIIGHSEVPGATHTDPGQNWNWDKYLSLIRQNVNGHIQAFAEGADQQLRTQRYQPGSGWQPAALGGSAITAPSAVIATDDGSRHVFARGADDQLTHWWYEGGWRHETLPGSIMSAPAVAVSPVSGELHVFGRGSGNRLGHWLQDGQGWFHEELAGPVTSAPAVRTSPVSSTLHVFAKGSDGRLGHWLSTGDGWFHEQLAGPITSAPAVEASPQSGTLHVFAKGSDGKLGHWLSTGDAWFHEQLSGVVNSRPAVAVSPVTSSLHVFAEGSGNRLGHWSYGEGGAWSHREIAGSTASAPAATMSPISETLHVFARGTDNQLSHWLWTGSEWFHENLSGPTHSAPSAITRYTLASH